MTLGLPAEAAEALLATLAERAVSGGVSDVSVAWDAVRRDAVASALRDHLLPAMEREARGRLAAEARGVVLEAAGERLWEDYASVGPLQVRWVFG